MSYPLGHRYSAFADLKRKTALKRSYFLDYSRKGMVIIGDTAGPNSALCIHVTLVSPKEMDPNVRHDTPCCVKMS